MITATTSTPKLELRQVSKSFREAGIVTPALHDLNLVASTGQFVTLIGPSGCGKSTAFNLITGLQKPDAGEILLDGIRINGQPGRVGYMPQRDLLLPWRTILDNVILGPEIQGQPRRVSRELAQKLLPTFGLEDFGNVYPATLSGGMRQRAALLRTFLLARDVMLLDEPFGALDALTRYDLQQWLLGIWQEFRPTILFITHDVREAVLLSDIIYVFSPRPGHIKLALPIDLPRPRDDSNPDFIQLQSTLLKALGQSTALPIANL